ncbi:pheromone-processing carboxypeptidase kex1 [Tothia fuscella]|uniref:Carboxypeptidase n=1 Tax=Tothia fuscella TaxID=1048955 RepID=A0A9P4NTJ5_9PEZI|nr:pheromone-processing carboxypeptidase kex1 [Tothia fuscella]
MPSIATAQVAKTAADYFVHSLPGAPAGKPLMKMHAGHIEVTPEHNGNLFFWHFANKHLADKPRTVIWINGGPGCSSEDGAMMEIGPYRVRPGGNLELQDGSWDEFANILFVDNPVGTGFSYVDTDSYVHELKDMADQFVLFLEKWFGLFPHYSHDDIYIAGESYAGQHIPYIATAMLERNKLHPTDPWNIQGLLIGNGWISGPDQYPSYLSYAYEHDLLKRGSVEANQVESQQAICTQALSDGGKDKVDVPECEEILQKILRVTQTRKDDKVMCYNMYDVRLTDEYPSCGMSWPPDLKDVTPYLRRQDVTAALHIDTDKQTGWQECNGAVGSEFTVRNSIPSVKLLPNLLEHMQITLFSGDKDLICNHKGTEALINNLSFNGAKGFEQDGVTAPRHDWLFEGEPAGIYQSARNLTYVKFYNSSHMVPFDYPRRTRDMLDRFMGVDIGTVGGKPVDSVIGGEKGPQTSVGGHTNSTIAEEDQAQKLKEASFRAYQKSGEVAFVIVLVAALAWGFFVWRDRRRRAGYKGVPGSGEGGGLEAFRSRGVESGGFRDRDLEAADFDENELDDLGGANGGGGSKSLRQAAPERDLDVNRYSLGDVSDSDEEGGKEKGANGHGK